MKTVGLITEYNPFHNGHLHHITEAKKITAADYVVVIMSGNFVQRGAPAIIPKHERAAMAISCGADIVLELPVFYAAASAEYFAEGAVAILNNLGIIDSLCFGSECNDIEALSAVASIMYWEPDGYKKLLKKYLKTGLNFPAARNKAIIEYCADTNISFPASLLDDIVSSPNNILGIEYLKALQKLGSRIKPYTIARIVSGYHDKDLTDPVASATSIRKAVAESIPFDTLKKNVPAPAYNIMKTAKGTLFPVFDNDFSLLLKYKLLTETTDTLCRYADVTNELASRIFRLLPEYRSFDQFCLLLKTKELTYSRISRALFHIILGIKKEHLELRHSPYVRLLGLNKAASHLLTDMKENENIALITKLAEAQKVLSEQDYMRLLTDTAASQIYYSVIADKFQAPCLNEYKRNIIIK